MRFVWKITIKKTGRVIWVDGEEMHRMIADHKRWQHNLEYARNLLKRSKDADI